MGFLSFLQNKATTQKISAAEQELADLRVKKAELDFEVKNVQQQINLEKQKSTMEIEKIKHTHSLELATLKAEAQQAKKLAEEKIKHNEEMLKSSYDAKENELKVTTKLAYEQQLAQEKINNEKKINELTAKHAEEKSQYQQDIQKNNYESLTKALNELNSNGNASTKFAQDLTMKLVDNAAKTLGTSPAVNVNTTHTLTSEREVGNETKTKR